MADPILLDASAWLAFLLKEEEGNVVARLLESHLPCAPDLIRYEAANSVLTAKRAGRAALKGLSLGQMLDEVWEFPIETIPMKSWWKKAENLVQHHSIAFYDASYIACARVLDMPLLTLDRKMIQISRLEDISVIPLPSH